MTEIPKNKNLIPKSENNVDVSVEELPKLRPKLRNLVELVLSGENQAKAHEIAKYKARDTQVRYERMHEILINPKVKKYVEIRQKQIAEDLRKKTSISKEFILNEFIASMNRSKEAKKERELIQAGAEINKMLGFNAPTEIKNTISKGLDLSGVPQEFIEKYIRLMDEYEAIQQGKIEAVEVKQIPESVIVPDKLIPENVNELVKVEIENEPKPQ